MSRPKITDVVLPPDEFRVDLHSRRFETAEFAAKEDAKRARMLRKRAKKEFGKRRARLLALAEKLDPVGIPEIPLFPETVASARYMRTKRIPILSWVCRLVAEDTTGSVVRYDVIKPGWECDRKGLRAKNPCKLKSEFRSELNRAANKVIPGGAAKCRGFLFAALHGDFETSSKSFQLHWHLIATGDWVTVVEGLRGLKAYRPTERVARPIRARKKIDNLAYAVTYLLKIYWQGKWRGPVSGKQKERRGRRFRRIPEPYHSDVLLWLDQRDLGDLILSMGIQTGKEGLSIKTVHE